MQTGITLPYAGLLGLLFIYLSWNVVRLRHREQVDIGAGESQDLARAIRAHANFAEYTPLGLLLVLLLENATAPAILVHLLGAVLVIGRGLHAYGFTSRPGVSFGRLWGTALTWAVLASGSLGSLYYGLVS